MLSLRLPDDSHAGMRCQSSVVSLGYFGSALLTSLGVSVWFLGLFETFVLLGLNVA